MMRMTSFTLAWKSLRHKPLSAGLNLVLMAIGIGMMTFVLSASKQLEDGALRDAQGIDLVVGAKGSPLQLILSSVYHIDVPTGNIPLATQQQLTANRMVRKAIPLALGDSYDGFRIVGTNRDYIEHYGGAIAQGKLFDGAMQAVFGAQAAVRTGATVGTRFAGSHGLARGGEEHKETPYTVVGILRPTGTVLDSLVLTPVESVWHVHEAEHEHEGASDDGRTHGEHELTALLVQYASPLAAMSMPRWINSQNGLQAAQPAFEAAKLFRMLGVGVDVLRAVAAIVLASAALSMFVSLYNALQERKTDLAILRTLGARPLKLFSLLLMEGMLLALSGAVLGWVIGHGAVGITGHLLSEDGSLALNAWTFAPQEGWLAFVAIMVGLAAALIPAVQAYRTEIAVTLAH